MNIQYCEKCSMRLDQNDGVVNPATSAWYCLKCAAQIPDLAPILQDRKQPKSTARKSSQRLSAVNDKAPAERRTPIGGTPAVSRKTPSEGTPVRNEPPPAFSKAGGNMAFYFCETCGRRVTTADLEAGRARNKQVKGVYCVDCAAGVNTVSLDAITLEGAKAIQREIAAKNTPVTAGSLAAHYNARARHKPAGTEPKKKQFGLQLAGAAGAIIALVVVLVLSGSQKADSESASKNESTATPQTEQPHTTEEIREIAKAAVKNDAAEGATQKQPEVAKAPLDSIPVSIQNPKLENPQVAELSKAPGTPTSKPPQTIPQAPAKNLPVDTFDTIVVAPTPPVAAPLSKQEIALRLFLKVAKENETLLAANKFADAMAFLERKGKDPAFADASDLLKQEKSDIGAVVELRRTAIEALRKKVGEQITLKKGAGTIKGKVVTESKPDLVTVNVGGPELSLRADQVDLEDIDRYAPRTNIEGDDLRLRGLLYLYAGQITKAKALFAKPQTLNPEPYLTRISALELGEVEASALRGWDKAEKLFAAGDMKEARSAYNAFFKSFEKTKTAEAKSDALMERYIAIDLKLSPATTLSLEVAPGVKMEFVYIRPGTFVMGGNDDPKGADQGVEKPRHPVRITKGFYLGKYEVTMDQYKAVTGKNPSHWRPSEEEPNRPVENVTWNDANEFCRLVSEKTRNEVRLPTEAEWEYACRAGSDTEWSHCSDAVALEEQAWFGNHGQGWTHSIGKKKPNAWGLYDIHGNAMEWVADWYGTDYYASSPLRDPTGPASGTLRITRGGGTSHCGDYICRSATRTIYTPDHIRADSGFRAAMTVEP